MFYILKADNMPSKFDTLKAAEETAEGLLSDKSPEIFILKVELIKRREIVVKTVTPEPPTPEKRPYHRKPKAPDPLERPVPGFPPRPTELVIEAVSGLDAETTDAESYICAKENEHKAKLLEAMKNG